METDWHIMKLDRCVVCRSRGYKYVSKRRSSVLLEVQADS